MKFLKENWLLVAAIAYLLLPVDFLPDVLPVLGLSDDLGVLLIALLTKYIQHKKQNSVEKTEPSKNAFRGPFWKRGKGKIVDGELAE